MSQPTTLDTLKDLLLRADNLISMAQDDLSGGDISTLDTEVTVEILDSVRKFLWDAVARHVPGVRYEFPHYTEAGAAAAMTYDDGTRVCEHIELRDGAVATYYPRHDGDRTDFVQRMEDGSRHLTLVEESTGTGITSLQEAALRHLHIMRASAALSEPREQMYIHLAFTYGLSVTEIVEASGLSLARVQELLAVGGK